MPLAHELGGDLPCVRCRYNLRGLSIRAVCPECGTPLRATLLAVVDPLATEFKPIHRPALTALGLTAWAFAALASCLAAWALRTAEIAPAIRGLVGEASGLRWAVPILAAVSGVGAIAFIRPHGGIRPADVRRALLGALLYLPLCVLLAYSTLRSPAAGPSRTVSDAPGGTAAIVGIATCALLMLILILLRPNARLLAARSLLMRSGRVDRQTMRTVAAVLGLCIAGYACGLAADMGHQPLLDVVRSVGGLLLLVGWSMFLLGLIGIAHDCWLIRSVIAEPPLSLTDLLSENRREGAPRPSRVWSHKP